MHMTRYTISTLLAAVLAALALASASAQAPSTAPCVDIKLFNLNEGGGTVNIAVWGSADTFFKRPVWVNQAKVTGSTMTVAMCGVTASEVAITLFQDLNGNGKMDSNPMGIPTEPYGASGKPPMFSAPTWETTKVAVDAGKPIEIRL